MDDRALVMSDKDYERVRVRVEQLASAVRNSATAAELAALLRAMRAWERLRDEADAIGARPVGITLQ